MEKSFKNLKVLFDNHNVIGGRYLMIDIETTGLDPSCSDIIEVHYDIVRVFDYDFEDYKVEESVGKLFYSENSKNTEHLHKIKESEILSQEMSFVEDGEFKRNLKSLIEECAYPESDLIFMAYHLPFEISFFKHFLGISDDVIEKIRLCDPRMIETVINPDISHKLRETAPRYGIVPTEGDWAFHRAGDDVIAMRKVFFKQILICLNFFLLLFGEYDPETYKTDLNYFSSRYTHKKELLDNEA